ncbi:MAG: serine/threonine-protein kinase [Lacipirellulaceae bacterium]
MAIVPPAPLDPAALLAIDACCDRFEEACAQGKQPRCEDFLQGTPSGARLATLAELFALELLYAGDDAEHRAAILSRAGLVDRLHELGASARDLQAVVDAAAATAGYSRAPTQAGRASGALRVRCPHCQNGVELLPDAPLDSITCRSCGSAFGLDPESAGASSEPPSVGRFVLVERLGVGGFGAVWRARDPELQREVAIKLPRRAQLDRQEVELFWREARAAAQLSHPNIVPVHEVGRDGDRVYIVSELVRGVSLADRLKQWRPTPREAAALLATICEALDYAHARGVVHRDLKPSNVMIDAEGAPHVLDFGLAKRDVGEVTMTVDGQVLGTPAYMSPEQAGGFVRWVDRRTDVYSLGVILFQMLTGELPFRGTVQSQIQQRLSDDPPDPRRYAEHTPADVATLCLKCLERDPNRRYPTAGEVAAELRRFVRGEPIVARPISRLSRAARWAKRRPAQAAALALGATLAIAGPTAAVVIGFQRASLAARLAEITEVVRRDELKVEGLEQQKDALRARLASGATSSDVTWRSKVASAYLAKHGERLRGEVAPGRGAVTLARLYLLAGEDGIATELLTAARGALVGPELAECERLLAQSLRNAGRASDAAAVEVVALKNASGADAIGLQRFVEALPTEAGALNTIARQLGDP